MVALCEAVDHWDHVDGCEDGHDIGVAVVSGVGESAPDCSQYAA